MSDAPTFYDVSSVYRPADRIGEVFRDPAFTRSVTRLRHMRRQHNLDTASIMRKLMIVPPSRGLVAYETHGPCVGHMCAVRVDFR